MEKQPENLIWHYTTRAHGEEIIETGVLQVSKLEKKKDLKPAIWFSKQQFWEPTACKVFSSQGGWLNGKIGMQTQHEMAGIYRFGVVYNPSIFITWAKYKYASKINPELHRAMENDGVSKGGIPSDWYACFHDIRNHLWKSIEVFDGSKWIPLNDFERN